MTINKSIINNFLIYFLICIIIGGGVYYKMHTDKLIDDIENLYTQLNNQIESQNLIFEKKNQELKNDIDKKQKQINKININISKLKEDLQNIPVYQPMTIQQIQGYIDYLIQKYWHNFQHKADEE